MANDLENVLKKYSLQIIKKNEQQIGNFTFLKQAAQSFLTSVKIYNRKYTEVTLKGKIDLLHNLMETSTPDVKLILKNQHDFEEAVNIFLGRVVFLNYVNSDGTINIYTPAEIGKKVYQKAYKKSKTTAGISSKSMDSIQGLKKYENLRKAVLEASKNKQQVFIEATRRFDKTNVDENHKRVMHYPNWRRTFYWRLYSKNRITGWTLQSIGNKGHIAEGYADLVINDYEDSVGKIIDNTNVQYGLEKLASLIMPNNISGIKKGDIQLNSSDGIIQFAIKSSTFNTSSIDNDLALALNIKTFQSLSIEALEDNFDDLIDLSKVGTVIFNDMKKDAIERIQKIAASLDIK